ncbi:MAG: N-acetylmuramic acid 6-phosphate etherase [Clostridia bacterium]|nr:N-acetylmuramic acid 6-phosphate etherase [Clostridia bacterium]
MRETEMRNPKTTHIDRMSTIEMIDLLNEENLNAVRAVADARDEIARAVDALTEVLDHGKRIFYVGAGTSGRLGVVDASECPPTFGVSPETVTGIIAGGRNAMFEAGEKEEDSAETGGSDLCAAGASRGDAVVGISAAGSAPYVIGALEKAKELGCVTVSLTSNPGAPITRIADIAIVTRTGAEAVTGSTRMKAGTAQKLVLNALSTCAMIKTGKVYENLMINLKPSNAKLRARMIGIVKELTGLDEKESERLLEAHQWDIRRAVCLVRTL